MWRCGQLRATAHQDPPPSDTHPTPEANVAALTTDPSEMAKVEGPQRHKISAGGCSYLPVLASHGPLPRILEGCGA